MSRADYTFESYTTTSSNRLARLAAEAVCESPGEKFNPLYIYGPSGVGKTHLLHAIAHTFREKEQNVIHISGKGFLEELVESIRDGKNIEFRDRYHQTEVLIVDNLQYISGKESSQEELLNIVDILLEDGKQIVFAADCTAKSMPYGLREELESFLEMGFCVEMQTPDIEARTAIVSHQLQRYGIHWPEEACRYVALNAADNVSQIRGEIQKIIACKELF